MPGGGGVGVGAYSQGITQNPNLPNQPNPQGVVGTNNPNYLRRRNYFSFRFTDYYFIFII